MKSRGLPARRGVPFFSSSSWRFAGIEGADMLNAVVEAVHLLTNTSYKTSTTVS